MEVVRPCEAGSRSLRRYRCGASFVDTGEEEGRELGSPSEVPSHCARRRSAGPYPNAKPTCRAELPRVESPTAEPGILPEDWLQVRGAAVARTANSAPKSVITPVAGFAGGRVLTRP